MDAVAEVKERLNIEDVVSEYVQLKRAGRNFKGLSPFTNEKTPSFIVSPEKQIWHDFSSGKGGDVISFIQAVEGLDFRGSLELLARKAGVDLSSFSKNFNPEKSQKKDRLYKLVKEAVGYYQQQLLKHEEPLRYLREKRGYEKQTIIDFKFGYAPNQRNALSEYLLAKGFSEQEMVDAGVVSRRDSGIVDMFRGRITVPLSDAEGRAVGFTARQLKADTNSPKYINTPATLLYDKGRQLFGMHMAKDYIRKAGYAVVVEGNLDVVASWQAGVRNVVASAGTALTTFHLKTLQRFSGDVRIAFDDDRAGQEAAERTIPLAQELGIELSLITIPEGKDPDELIQKDVKLWKQAVENSSYMVDWLIEKHSQQVDLQTAQGKRQFTTQVLTIVQQLKDDVEQEHYLRIIAEKTHSSLDSVKKKFDQPRTEKVHLKKVKTQPSEPTGSAEQLVRVQHFLAICTHVPVFLPLISELPNDVYSERAQDFLNQTSAGQQMKEGGEYGKMLSLLFEETYQHTERSELLYQTKQLLSRLIDFYVNNKKTEIIHQLQAEELEDEQRLLTEVATLQKLKSNVLDKYSALIDDDK